MAENSDIPGFYKCPQTGKYFRIPADGDFVGKVTRNKTRPMYQQKVNEHGAYKSNIPSLLSRMQIGLPSRKIESEYWTSKFANFVTPISRSNICSRNCRHFSQSMLLKSTDKTIFYESEYFNGDSKYNCYHEHKMPVDDTILHNDEYRTIQCRFSGHPVDICKVSYSTREYFVRIMNTRFGMHEYILFTASDPSGSSMSITTEIAVQQPIWCCTANNAVRKVFFGTVGGVRVLAANLYDSQFLPFSRRLSRKVHSIDVDAKGNNVYCGIHNGRVMIKDRREESETATTIRLYDRDGLNEIKLLNNQHHLICGSFGGQMSMLDLRTGGCIARYIGHKSSPKKLLLSVLESQQLLCATGSDKITRLWSLNGGVPLVNVYPPSVTNKISSCVEDSSPCQACLCHSDKLDSLCILQDCAVHVYPLNKFGLDG